MELIRGHLQFSFVTEPRQKQQRYPRAARWYKSFVENKYTKVLNATSGFDTTVRRCIMPVRSFGGLSKSKAVICPMNLSLRKCEMSICGRHHQNKQANRYNVGENDSLTCSFDSALKVKASKGTVQR